MWSLIKNKVPRIFLLAYLLLMQANKNMQNIPSKYNRVIYTIYAIKLMKK
jgi:hypothetical protein